MSAEVTPEQMAEWRALAEAATEGPWMSYEDDGGRETGHGHSLAGNRRRPDGHDRDVMAHIGKCWGWGPTEANAAFIAAARTAVPALLDTVERLQLAGECTADDRDHYIERANKAEAERDAALRVAALAGEWAMRGMRNKSRVWDGPSA